MTNLILCLTTLLAIANFARAEITQLTDDQRKILMASTNFHEVHSITNLPSELVALCEVGSSGMADPGKNWEPTDYIRDKKLPRTRLIWAAVSGEYYLVHYEKGGYFQSSNVVLAQLKKGDTKALMLWRAIGGPFKNYNAFIKGLKAKKLDDTPW